MKTLKISKEISLPTDVVTQTIAILAKRRAGKSYTMRKITEQLLDAGEQVIIVDPKGDQWGIRSSSDGKSPGFPIVILGGEHADVPLEVNAGEVVAKLVVEERVSILLDLSMFRKHEIATFMAIFLENLYRLKAREEYRTPVMLIIDEADAVAPQKPQKGEERMLGAAEDIVRRGGQRGIGCMLVTQRSAVLNKNVLTQAQMLIVLRTIAPQDLAAMKAWIDVHGTLEQGKELMTSLPSLPIGDAWFWSPGWPTEAGIFARSHILPIITFDSGSTPKPGEKKIVPKNLADVNLEALKKQMAATIEKAKSDNPKELRKKIADLEKQIKEGTKRPDVDTSALKHRTDTPMGVSQWMNYGAKYGYDKFFEKKILTANDKKWQAEAARVNKEIKSVAETFRKIRNLVPETLPVIKYPGMGIDQSAHPQIMPQVVSNEPLYPRKDQPRAFPKDLMEFSKPKDITLFPDVKLGGGELAVLTAIAQFEGRGVTREHITVLTGYKRSTRDRYIATLTQRNFVQLANGKVYARAEGIEALGPDFQPLPTGSELRRHLLSTLPEGERKILHALIDAYPSTVTREGLTEFTGYQRSTRDRYLQSMSAREIIVTLPGGIVQLNDKLFE